MWPGPFDHHLNVVVPGLPGQLSQCFQFGELSRIAGVGDGAGPQSIAQGEADIVFLEDLADRVEVLIEQILLVILHHPFSQDRPAAAYDPGDPFGCQRNVLHQHAGVNGHVIDALLGLLLDDFEHHVDVQIFNPADAGKSFVYRHRPDRHWRILDDLLADERDVAPGRQVHHGISAELDGVPQLLQFLIDIRGG